MNFIASTPTIQPFKLAINSEMCATTEELIVYVGKLRGGEVFWVDCLLAFLGGF